MTDAPAIIPTTPWPSARDLAAYFPARPVAMLRDGTLALIVCQTQLPAGPRLCVWPSTPDDGALRGEAGLTLPMIEESEVGRRWDQLPDREAIEAWRSYDRMRAQARDQAEDAA